MAFCSRQPPFGSQCEDPQEVKDVVEAELKLIQEHNQTATSPLMAMGSTPDPLESLKEDYTQYIPAVIIPAARISNPTFRT